MPNILRTSSHKYFVSSPFFNFDLKIKILSSQYLLSCNSQRKWEGTEVKDL